MQEIGGCDENTTPGALKNGNILPIAFGCAIVISPHDWKHPVAILERKSAVPVARRENLFDAVANSFMKLSGLVQRFMNKAFAKRCDDKAPSEFF